MTELTSVTYTNNKNSFETESTAEKKQQSFTVFSKYCPDFEEVWDTFG